MERRGKQYAQGLETEAEARVEYWGSTVDRVQTERGEVDRFVSMGGISVLMSFVSSWLGWSSAVVFKWVWDS